MAFFGWLTMTIALIQKPQPLQITNNKKDFCKHQPVERVVRFSFYFSFLFILEKQRGSLENVFYSFFSGFVLESPPLPAHLK